jgi:hypothetical protein
MNRKIFLFAAVFAGTSVNAMQEFQSGGFSEIKNIETAQAMIRFFPRPDRPFLVCSEEGVGVYCTLDRVDGQIVGGHYSSFHEGNSVTSQEIDKDSE